MLKNLMFLMALLVPSLSYAVVQQYTFPISGANGETGSGTFTWDDATVPNGNPLNTDPFSISADVLSISIFISGGTVIGGSTSFAKADCTGAWLTVTPDFLDDINFWCDNGTNTLAGAVTYKNELNSVDYFPEVGDGTSTLSFAPPPAPIPTISVWGLGILAGLLGLMGFVRRRKA